MPLSQTLKSVINTLVLALHLGVKSLTLVPPVAKLSSAERSEEISWKIQRQRFTALTLAVRLLIPRAINSASNVARRS